MDILCGKLPYSGHTPPFSKAIDAQEYPDSAVVPVTAWHKTWLLSVSVWIASIITICIDKDIKAIVVYLGSATEV